MNRPLNSQRQTLANCLRAVPLLFALAATPLPAQSLPALPAIRREARAAWTASVSNIDWPTGTGLTTAQQQSQLTGLMDNLVAANMNQMYLQVRPACDAFYVSSIEPWSQWLRGTQGRAPSPSYDPLAFAVTEARKRGIELHAWINPYRAALDTTTSTKAANHISRTRPDLVRNYGSLMILDPGEPDSPAYVISVIRDIVRRYDVDGIVFDDYFYPYPITSGGSTVPFPDSTSYAKYTAAGGTMSLGDWRRDNVNRMVRDVNLMIKQEKPTLRFGIAPFGIWRPGNPSGVSGLDSYSEIYADSRKWLQQGWLDYFSPQLYWPTTSTGQPYGALLTWWTQQNTLGRHMWPSNYTSRVNDGTASAFTVSELQQQINVTRSTAGATGNVHFSIKTLRDNKGGLTTALKGNQYAAAALVPATTWLDSTPPPAPVVTPGAVSGANRTVSWSAATGAEAARWWTLYSLELGVWMPRVIPGPTTSATIPATATAVAVRAVDALGNEGPPTTVRFNTAVGDWGKY